jgi:hypothetical protein
MAIDTLGYVKRLEAPGIDRRHAEAHAEAMRDEVAPQLASKADLDAAVTRLEQKFETLLWKHTLGILLGVLTIGRLLRFVR